MRKDGFILQESKGVPHYICQAFADIPFLCHGFSTRNGGSANAESSFDLGNSDSMERVHENRRRFLSSLNFQDGSLVSLHQIHSNRVYIIEDEPGEWNQSEGDALATRVVSVALAVKTADCLPILLADPVKHAVAAVHSGWRGTLSGVLPHTILQMRKSFSSMPSDLLAAVGPGIRACCFEVGSEVVKLFEEKYPGSHLAEPVPARDGKHLLDLSKAIEIQLDRAGLRLENCHDLGLCTCCNTDRFFSYRAEGSSAGRMMSVIGYQQSLIE
jgi:polyphenol oxidase